LLKLPFRCLSAYAIVFFSLSIPETFCFLGHFYDANASVEVRIVRLNEVVANLDLLTLYGVNAAHYCQWRRQTLFVSECFLSIPGDWLKPQEWMALGRGVFFLNILAGACLGQYCGNCL